MSCKIPVFLVYVLACDVTSAFDWMVPDASLLLQQTMPRLFSAHVEFASRRTPVAPDSSARGLYTADGCPEFGEMCSTINNPFSQCKGTGTESSYVPAFCNKTGEDFKYAYIKPNDF